MTYQPGDDVRRDMAEQAAAVEAMLSRGPAQTDVADLDLASAAGVMFVGRGSSHHVGRFGRYLFEAVLGKPVVLVTPSLYTRYQVRPDLSGWIAIAISQSGATPEIATTLDILRQCGARAVAVTNDPRSLLAERADTSVDLACGVERATAATKTVTTSIAALMVMARSMAAGAVPWTPTDEARAVEAMRMALADEVGPTEAAAEPPSVVSRTHVARGLTAAAAYESALKFREMTGLPAEATSAAEYLHGPVAAAGSGTRIVAYVTPGAVAGDVLRAVHAGLDRGASVLWVGSSDVLPQQAASCRLTVMPRLHEYLAVLPLLVRAQQLALARATLLGVNPDHPAGLNKVTVTT